MSTATKSERLSSVRVAGKPQAGSRSGSRKRGPAGVMSESGRDDYEYEYKSDRKLGDGEAWELTSGTELQSGSGEYHYRSSGGAY